jgi:serine/threonine-protein kinase
MSSNPYTPPAANIDKTTTIAIPEEIAKKIKNCWIAGLISIGITGILMLAALAGANPLGLSAAALIDAAVMAGLTFGVYKNSRVCAVLLLSFFALNKALMWGGPGGTVSGIPMALIFFWFYFQGVVGTFQLHKLKKTAANATAD